MNYMGCVDNVGNTIQEADGVPPPPGLFLQIPGLHYLYWNIYSNTLVCYVFHPVLLLFGVPPIFTKDM